VERKKSLQAFHPSIKQVLSHRKKNTLHMRVACLSIGPIRIVCRTKRDHHRGSAAVVGACIYCRKQVNILPWFGVVGAGFSSRNLGTWAQWRNYTVAGQHRESTDRKGWRVRRDAPRATAHMRHAETWRICSSLVKYERAACI
jgi:hypothetical protein